MREAIRRDVLRLPWARILVGQSTITGAAADEVRRLQEGALERYFGAISALFKYYSGWDDGDSATINMSEFDHFLGKIHFFGDKQSNFSAKVAVENIFKYGGTKKPSKKLSTGVGDGDEGGSKSMPYQARAELSRHEFIGCLIALACYRIDNPLSAVKPSDNSPTTLNDVFAWFCHNYIGPVSGGSLDPALGMGGGDPSGVSTSLMNSDVASLLSNQAVMALLQRSSAKLLLVYNHYAAGLYTLYEDSFTSTAGWECVCVCRCSGGECACACSCEAGERVVQVSERREALLAILHARRQALRHQLLLAGEQTRRRRSSTTSSTTSGDGTTIVTESTEERGGGLHTMMSGRNWEQKLRQTMDLEEFTALLVHAGLVSTPVTGAGAGAAEAMKLAAGGKKKRKKKRRRRQSAAVDTMAGVDIGTADARRAFAMAQQVPHDLSCPFTSVLRPPTHHPRLLCSCTLFT
jgi:hypothetical protein